MVARIAPRAVRRPRPTAPPLRSAWRFRRRGWFRRSPFLRLPPAEHLELRLHTAFGEAGALPEPDRLGRTLRRALRSARRGP